LLPEELLVVELVEVVVELLVRGLWVTVLVDPPQAPRRTGTSPRTRIALTSGNLAMVITGKT
jgi:hypothetical protein